MKKVKLYHNFIKRNAFYLLLSLSLIGMTGCNTNPSQNPSVKVAGEVEQTPTPTPTPQEEMQDGPVATEVPQEQMPQEKVTEAEIHFIDTGNSDAILIMAENQAMLIDGGDNDDEQLVVSYLKDQGVTELEYVIATHPHADHIGGLDAVIESYKVKQLLVANGDAETKTYRDFINAAMDKGLSPSVPLEDSKFPLGNSYFTVMNTNGGDDTNNQSLVIEYVNGEDKMLFMGDAEKEVEEELLPKLSKVDLLKVGHHGSSSSTTEEFLKKVNPTYSVILCSAGNKYGHPHRETMINLQGTEVHRSDECGTIVFKSTGKGLVTDCKIGSYTSGSDTKASTSQSDTSNNTSSNTTSSNTTSENDNSDSTTASNNINQSTGNTEVVYWTPKGKSYHTTKDCSALVNSKTILSGTISESGKYDPCDRCH